MNDLNDTDPIDTDLNDTDLNDPAFESIVRASLARRADLAADVTAPEFRPDGDLAEVAVPGARRRRMPLLAAAAALLVVVAVAALLRSPSDHSVQVTPATSKRTETEAAVFVSDWYPAGMVPDGEIEPYAQPSAMDRVVEYRLLGRGGRAEVVAWATVSPLSLPGGFRVEEPEPIEIRGVPALRDSEHGVQFLALAIRPGLTLTLVGQVSGEQLERLAAAFADRTAEFAARLLPDGWSELEDPDRLAVAGPFGPALPSAPIASWYASNRSDVPTNSNLTVSYVAADDPARAIERLEGVWGGERIDIDGRAALSMVGPYRFAASELVAVQLDDHHLGWVAASGLPRTEVERFARSIRRGTRAEWPGTTPVTRMSVVDGFELQGSDARILVTGEVDGMRWAFATVAPDDTAESTPAPLRPHQLAFLHPDGLTTNVWLPGANTIQDPSVSRDPRLLVAVGFAPIDVADPGLSFEGTALETQSSPIPGRDVQLVFAALPAIDHDDSMQGSRELRVTGTRADGSPYVSDPLDGSGMSFALGRTDG